MEPDPQAHTELSGTVDGDVAMVRDVHGNIIFNPPPATQAPAAPRVPDQLPPATWHFTGRAAALAELDAAAETATAVVITDPTPGLGKSTLAVHWARLRADRFPDGRLHLDLRGSRPGHARHPADVVRDVLAALGEPAHRGDDAQLSQYRTLLSNRRVLLMLDDARDAEQVRPLLPPGTGSLALVTGRGRLGALAARPVAVGDLDVAESTELLARVVGTARVEAERAAAHHLVLCCAGLPGALVAVATAAGTGPLGALAAELDRDPGVRAAPDPRTRAQAVIAWSRTREAPHRPVRVPGGAPWLRDHRVLAVAAAVAAACVLGVTSEYLSDTPWFAVPYYLLRCAILAVAVVWIGKTDHRRVIGVGAALGTAVNFLADAFVSANQDGRFLVWLELLSAVFLTVLLVLRAPRLRPDRVRWLPPAGRPAAIAVGAGVLLWFVLLFIAFQVDEYHGFTTTLIQTGGALGMLLPIAVVGGLALYTAALEPPDDGATRFAEAAVLAYLVPEVLLLLTNLIPAGGTAYLGHVVLFPEPVAWLVALETLAAAAIAGGVGWLTRGGAQTRWSRR